MYLLKAYGEVGAYETGEDPHDLSVGIIFHNPLSDSLKYLVSDPSLDWSINRSGTFSFLITKEHRCYSSIASLKTYISIHYFNNQTDNLFEAKEYWRGRVVSIEKRMNGNYSIKCEGIMSLLNDVEYSDDYYDTYDLNEQVEDTIMSTDVMYNAIQCYNKHLLASPTNFSECCREFVFAPMNIGAQKPVTTFDSSDSATKSSVWSKIESIVNDNNGYIRAEYNSTIDKYILYYTGTTFNWNEDADEFSVGGDVIDGVQAKVYPATPSTETTYEYFSSDDYLSVSTIPGYPYWKIIQGYIYPYDYWDYGPDRVYYYRDFSYNVHPVWPNRPTLPLIYRMTCKIQKNVTPVYKYFKGDCVTYQNRKYVFIEDHLWGVSWDSSQVVEYHEPLYQDIELGVNLIDIIKNNNVSDLYSHLKAYGKEIEFIDFFADCEKVYTEGSTSYYHFEMEKSVQPNSWYRFPLVVQARRDGPWNDAYYWYTKADYLGITIYDGDGNYISGGAKYYRLLDDSALITYYTDTEVVTNALIMFNSYGNIYHDLDKSIDENNPSGTHGTSFRYVGETLPVGTKIVIKIHDFGNHMGLYDSYRYDAYIYTDPESENYDYTFETSTSTSPIDPSQYDGIYLGLFNFTKQLYCYNYFTTEGISDEYTNLKAKIESPDVHEGEDNDIDGPWVSRFPYAKKDALLTPTGTPTNYEYLENSDAAFPSELIDSQIYDFFGRIDKIENYNDISNRDELFLIASDKVTLDSQKPYSAKIKALDLSNVNSLYEPFYPGFDYTIKPYSENGDSIKLQCSSIKIPLLSIKNSEYSFGFAKDLITNKEYINGQWRRKKEG